MLGLRRESEIACAIPPACPSEIVGRQQHLAADLKEQKPAMTARPEIQPSTAGLPQREPGQLRPTPAAPSRRPLPGIKVVDKLNSERLRDLSQEAKRASVLMALDAAGISADDLLTDAARRQNALTSYETGQAKQLEDFEARKAKENARIEEEMEKIRLHHALRVQANLDQVAEEKDALRTWQMAMQHETQRITEVIKLCGKQPAPAVKGNAMAAAAAGAPPYR